MIHAFVNIVAVTGFEFLATVDTGEFQSLDMSLYVVAQILKCRRLFATDRTGQPSVLIFDNHWAHCLVHKVFIKVI